MPWKKKLLNGTKLYLILDRDVKGYDQLFEILQRSVAAGVDIVQLRDKHGLAKDIVRFTTRAVKFLNGRIPFIINDRADIAAACGSAGVHVGQDDLSIAMARKIIGPRAIVGVSCQTLAQAEQAQASGADYIGFGSVFQTLTKPGRHSMDLKLLTQAVREIRIPVFAIGGINLDNVSELCQLGVKRVAVCRAICEAVDVRRTTTTFKKILNQNKDVSMVLRG